MKLKLTVTAALLVLAILACTNPLGEGLSDADQIATTVAETLAASGVEGAGDNLPDPSAIPGLDQPGSVRVAYVDNRDLVIWTEGVGSAVVYSGDKVTDMIFSDDGSLVAFKTVDAQNFFNGLWVVNTDGSNLRQLLNAATVTSLSPIPEGAVGVSIFHWQFIPGTHTLAFNTNVQFVGPGLQIQDDLHLVNADAGTLSTLFPAGQGGMFYYSPDGSQIAVVKPGEIDLVNADGSNRREDVLIHPHINTASEYQFYAVPIWGEDGSELKATIPSAEPFGDSPTMGVWTIPTDSSAAVMTHGVSTDMGLFPNGKHLAPDLDRLAYVFRVGARSDNIRDLRTVNLDSSSETTLLTGSVQVVSWDRTGEWIAFREGGNLLVVNAAGGAVQPLSDVLPAIRFEWLEDNGRFVFVSGAAVTEVFEIRIKRIGESSVLIGVAHNNTPAFAVWP